MSAGSARSSPARAASSTSASRAKRVIFCGTFTAGGLKVAIENGALRIEREGRARKFVDEVEHRTFSGEYAVARGQRVLYVTERCVFTLTPSGLELTEIAPGIDIDRDILAQMDFRPIVNAPVLDGRAAVPARADGAAARPARPPAVGTAHL